MDRPISDDRTEDWFLTQLEEPEIPVDDLVAWLGEQRGAENREQVESLAELLQETLQERDASERALEVLRLRASWHEKEARFRKSCQEQALDILGSAPEHRAVIQNVGFDTDIPVSECFRRLDVLQSLEPGVLCYDKTWGFGIVRKADWFYKRVDIDFDRKPEHHMSFGYAAETLELLDDDHLLARRHKDPDGFQALCKDDPAEVVRIALRSFGPLSAAQLAEMLVPDIVAEDAWKRFWDTARKHLKKDPLVEMPAKRSEPIWLRKKEKAYDEEWFRALAAERKMPRILELVDEFRSETRTKDISQAQLAVIGDRLAFVVKGAGRKKPGLVVQSVLVAEDLGVSGEHVDVPRHVEEFLMAPAFLAAVRAVPARDVRKFVGHLHGHEPDRTIELLLAVLSLLDLTALNEAMELLLAQGQEEACAAIFRDLTVEKEDADVEVLYWLYRHPEYLQKWALGTLPDLARWILRALDKDHSGERLKTQNQLRTRFEDKAWLKSVLEQMSESERRDLVRRVKDNRGWSSMDKRSVLGGIIKQFPELEEVLVSREEAASAKMERGPVTSFRSYRERQAQLEKIVNVEIPRVSREIAKARSYGDLSENHEYKAAKEMQGLLMRRQAELEEMLHTVRPTKFDEARPEVAGQATGVTLQYADGREERYFILGVWDRDEALGIISSESRMAQALEGRRRDEEISVPSENGQATCRITEITGLSDEVRQWIEA